MIRAAAKLVTVEPGHLSMNNSDAAKIQPAWFQDGIEACPLCGGVAEILYQLPQLSGRTGDPARPGIRWCRQCDFGFLHPRCVTEELDRLKVRAESATGRPKPVPTLLETIRIHLAWRIGRIHARQIDARLIHSIIGKHDATIAVAGSAPADLLVGLEDVGHRIIRVEFDDDSWRRAGVTESDSHARSGQGGAARLPEACVDAIVLLHTLESCREPRKALCNAHRLLLPGGSLLVEVPNFGAYSARRYGPSWSLCNVGRHLNFFTEKSLTRLFVETDYEIKDILYRQYVPQFESSRLILEQEKWDRLYANLEGAESRSPPRKSTADLWTGLAGTTFVHPSRKYEILAIMGTKCPE
jgi:SAM-dependent methyltransferase